MFACLVLLGLLFACAAPITTPPPVHAQDGGVATDSALDSDVRTAALFKNGFAFVHREAMLDGSARQVRLSGLPPPVHGTFWLAADPAQVELGPAVARRSVIREPRPATTVRQVLRANVGREVTLDLGEGRSVTGTLLPAPDEPPRDERPAELSYRPPVPAPPDLVLLGMEGGTMALSAADVESVVSEAGALDDTYESRRDAVSLSFPFVPRAGGATPLSIMYLERGLTWVPSYAIDVSDAERATLTAKAEVINEVEDLEDATLQFVTGFPNLQFAHVVDPIALQGDLDAFLGALGQAPAAGAPAVMSQAVLSNVASFERATFPVGGPPAGGTSVEDLFFYEQPGVTLRRGERGLYPLFTVQVPYEDLYQWRIADSVDGQQARRDGQAVQEEIWHSVRLDNDSTVPWTTAPAMTMKDGNLLGQDTLRYAAVGARTTVRVTRAIDVQGEQAEYELRRERDAASFHGRSYDRVTVKGELFATSHKREAVRLEITKQLQGEITGNLDGAEVVTVAEGLRKVNPSTRLTWSVPLEPGETAGIGYEYTLFVRP